jgi:hypothetical protein
LRDYLTDLFLILELGTSAKMLSIVPPTMVAAQMVKVDLLQNTLNTTSEGHKGQIEFLAWQFQY